MAVRIDIADLQFPKVTPEQFTEMTLSAFVTFRMAMAENAGKDDALAAKRAVDMWSEFPVEHRAAWVAAVRDVYWSLAIVAGAPTRTIPEEPDPGAPT